jgi:hypothetical protein
MLRTAVELIALARVARGTCMRRASSESVAQLSRSAMRTASISCKLRRRGRPSLLPRTQAAAIPARVRSLIRARSNSASAPMTWNKSRPPDVSVSIASQSEKPWHHHRHHSPVRTPFIGTVPDATGPIIGVRSAAEAPFVAETGSPRGRGSQTVARCAQKSPAGALTASPSGFTD